MSSSSPVADELDDHLQKLNGWVTAAKELSVPVSEQGVVNRFIGDCQNLGGYISGVETPTTADLCDFSDRVNSLEIQFGNLRGNQ